jgi:hypothetical protein
MATDESWLVHLYLTAAYAQKGDMARAADAKARLLSRKPGFTLAELSPQQSAGRRAIPGTMGEAHHSGSAEGRHPRALANQLNADAPFARSRGAVGSGSRRVSRLGMPLAPEGTRVWRRRTRTPSF